MGNKEIGTTIGCVVCGAAAVAGVTALCVCTGGTALLAGSVALGAGISGTANSVQQGLSDNDEFNYGSLAVNVAVGGVTGVATAGAGVASTSLATSFALKGASKVALSSACYAASGSLTSISGKAANNKVDDRPVTEGLGKAAVIGGLAGSLGAVGSKGASYVTKYAGVTSDGGKILAGAFGGGTTGVGVGATTQIADNLISGEDWNNNIGSAAGQGLVIGAVTGAIAAKQKINSKKNWDKIRKENKEKKQLEETKTAEKNSKTRREPLSKQTMDGKRVMKVIKKGKIVYYEKTLIDRVDEKTGAIIISKEKQLQGYQKAADLGAGMQIEVVSKNKNGIIVRTKAATPFREAIKTASIQEAKNYKHQVINIASKFKKAGLAHTDLKPDNLVVQDGKVFTIDNDFITKFGEFRYVITPGYASTVPTGENRGPVHYDTDTPAVNKILAMIDRELQQGYIDMSINRMGPILHGNLISDSSCRAPIE